MSKIHLGIRPFICDKCGISYSDEPELRMHIARHAENKPYSCNFCSYSTFQKSSLKCKCMNSSVTVLGLISQIIVSIPVRSRLRSADNDDMIVPRTRTARYGPRSFCVVAPQIWNMLPPHLKNINVSREQFKSSLKTWLFVQAYSQEAPLRTLFKRHFTNTRFDWLIDW